MLDQRSALIHERRKAAIATKLKKESIAKVMEEVRTNATKANKIIAQALTGKITLESLTGGGDSMAKRSKSADKLRKKTASQRMASDALGLGRNSKSAGGFEDTFDEDKLYSALEAGDASPAKPYISPYDSVPVN
jgi:hypothetical protein